MAAAARNTSWKKPSGPRVVTLVILLLVVGAVTGYYLFSPSEKTRVTRQKTELSDVKPVMPGPSIPQAARTEPPVVPQSPRKEQKKHPQATTIPEEKSGSVVRATGRLAIIIDDMGGSLSEARSLAAIKVPLTFSIIPGLRVDKDVAAYAAANSIETMIHIPMQSKGWPARRLESNGLLVSMDSDELQGRVTGFPGRSEPIIIWDRNLPNKRKR